MGVKLTKAQEKKVRDAITAVNQRIIDSALYLKSTTDHDNWVDAIQSLPADQFKALTSVDKDAWMKFVKAQSFSWTSTIQVAFDLTAEKQAKIASSIIAA